MGKKENSGWINNCARIIKTKKNSYFMVFERRKDKDGDHIGDNPFPMVINEGDTFNLRRKEDDLANLVKEGKISQETADKICETVRWEISRPPREENEKEPKKSEGKSNGKSAKNDDNDDLNF